MKHIKIVRLITTVMIFALGMAACTSPASNTAEIEATNPPIHTGKTDTSQEQAVYDEPASDVQEVSEQTNEVSLENTEAYNLFTPLTSTTTYLIDMDGEVVHTWESEYTPGNAVYYCDDGSILHTGSLGSSANHKFDAGGDGGVVERISWDSQVEWTFEYNTGDKLLHHDIEVLPNGNILMIAWETMTEDEAIESGRDPDLLADGELWPDHIIEVEPAEDGGEIVWEWHITDHLIQDYDSSKANYGDVSEHPEKIDINYSCSLGTNAGGADWTHINSIDYNEELDQILLSVHNFSEIWIIDHNTTTEEAASEKGDLLYRWGNPAAYDAGSANNQVFFSQHDAQWIETDDGYDMLVFNNGMGRAKKDSSYSTVDQITLPVDADGSYTAPSSSGYLPADVNWTYIADDPTSFYSASISGAQRLPDGNTLICEGETGRFFEITADGEIVWEYVNEFGSTKKKQKESSGGSVFRVTRVWLDISQ